MRFPHCSRQPLTVLSHSGAANLFVKFLDGSRILLKPMKQNGSSVFIKEIQHAIFVLA